ncbi:MAG: cysteine desulfuration protein SufE [Polyangiales bacterium]|jgi:cysteine desulfuration protein SufE
MSTNLNDVHDTFELIDDWSDRYAFLIEMGRELPPYPEELRDKAHKVKGCLSQVWLAAETRDGHMYFQADSDAHIVKGLVALVRLAFEGKTPSEVTDFDMDALLSKLGLDKHLTPGRSNGLHSMIKRIRAYAAA